MKKKVGALCVRFMEEDLKTINKISKKFGIWSSTWVRKTALEKLESMEQKTSEIKLETRER